jgi:outer membrane protein assembly factor BamE (lipoprotein component of BamABCDE complex)
MGKALARLALVAAGGIMLAGCAGVRDHKGQILDDQLASALQVGVDNKDSVAKTLGRPSFAGQFDDNDWYYVSRDTRALAFRTPRPTKQTILHVRFDSAGNVAAIERTGTERVASISPKDGRTPTLGRKKSFFDELFGNIGVVGAGGMGGGGGGPDQ